MARIQIEGLSKHFQDGDETVVAVEDLNLDVEDGEFVVFVGPSGCGKTTTLRCVAGLEDPTMGTIQIADDVVNDEPPEDRDIAMVFQSYALYPHMTVRENMSFGLEHSTDLTGDDIERKIQETAEMMGIEELLDRVPADLSGGQQQRVALGRAIVRDPKVFLMDEPLSNLDAKLRAEMRTYLQQLQEDIDVTTVYVTHDQTEAMTMGDKIAILNDGELQQYGTPAECYHEPENTFVAQFLGEPSINLVEMDVQNGTMSAGTFEYQLDGRLADAVDADSAVVGIRPEALTVSTGNSESDTAFTGTVAVVEHLGRESNIHIELDGIDVELTVIVDGRPSLSVDDSVSVHVPPEAMHVFDSHTGKVLRNASEVTERASLDL
ncbi:ABC transporter ATP-binding protein [Natrarchaeobius chitinivorans]|uniref:ABC-type D-xylose/L-arabinose transporter n=1 Tax=Natrarchaeobius chitinivorans TaxID=1679083 RepID=A0A3N6MJA9_NATCH|nr:ABC transporter ATP-binding protein [Natrarchaeobius chitinivorans]RQG94226.1 ABC transporter ATP-binding protein [Natrarchaeobius chitinivorans]